MHPYTPPNPKPTAPASASSDSMLDDLLAESLAERKSHEEVKAGRAMLARGGLGAADTAAINNAVRDWESKREWHPKAAVVMFSRQKCLGCGQFHTQFLGFYERQRHRSSSLDRWIKHFRPVTDQLPRESKYQDSYAEMCEDCAEHLGFEVEEG